MITELNGSMRHGGEEEIGSLIIHVLKHKTLGFFIKRFFHCPQERGHLVVCCRAKLRALWRRHQTKML